MTHTANSVRPLTKTEFRFLEALKKLAQRGYGPSLQECATEAGMGMDTARRCREALRELGKIEFDASRRRSMWVVEG